MKKQYKKKITMVSVNEQADHKHNLPKDKVQLGINEEKGSNQMLKKKKRQNVFFTNLISKKILTSAANNEL